jgi:hypothetical protein
VADFFNQNFCIALFVPGPATVFATPLELEYGNLVEPAVSHDLGPHRGTLYIRVADSRFAIRGDQQYLVEIYLLSLRLPGVSCN